MRRPANGASTGESGYWTQLELPLGASVDSVRAIVYDNDSNGRCTFYFRGSEAGFAGTGEPVVTWSRTVSPAPATATFADVPTSSGIFRFVEALAASGITGGCGGGNYCPSNPVTRGQMAVFLATALGLHWPD